MYQEVVVVVENHPQAQRQIKKWMLSKKEEVRAAVVLWINSTTYVLSIFNQQRKTHKITVVSQTEQHNNNKFSYSLVADV